MPKIPLYLRSVVNADGAALLDTELGTLTTLNETGAFVWRAIERGESQEAIVKELARITGESIQTIESDVQHFLDDLADRKLIADENGSAL